MIQCINFKIFLEIGNKDNVFQNRIYHMSNENLINVYLSGILPGAIIRCSNREKRPTGIN